LPADRAPGRRSDYLSFGDSTASLHAEVNATIIGRFHVEADGGVAYEMYK
jgi:hypothetical protein